MSILGSELGAVLFVQYFHVGKAGADRIAPGIATLIRWRWGKSSYLYLEGDPGYLGEGNYELVPDSKFWWGPWNKGWYADLKTYPMARKINALDAFKLIRKAI